MARKTKIERFNEKVLSRFQIYNSLFLTLPFKAIKQTSLLMPLFAEHCRIQYEKNSNPTEILNSFFSQYAPDLKAQEEQDNKIETRFNEKELLTISHITMSEWILNLDNCLGHLEAVTIGDVDELNKISPKLFLLFLFD